MKIAINRLFSSLAGRRTAAVGFAVAVLFSGCLGSTSDRTGGLSGGPTPAQMEPAPAKIVSLNPEQNFVVIDFTSWIIPPVGTQVTIYRNGKRVGAVRITEPARAQFATADIVEGEVHVGDEAR